MHRLIDWIIEADLALGLDLLGKVDLVDAYMKIWEVLTDIPSVAFLIPNESD